LTITSDWHDKDNRIRLGNYEISKSHNEQGKSIFWDRNRASSWIMFGYDGLTPFHPEQYDQFKVIGIDIIDLSYKGGI
jgi:hypothetical protein